MSSAEKAELVGPTQTPEFMENRCLPGWGYRWKNRYPDDPNGRWSGGRRLYGRFMVEAAVISQKCEGTESNSFTLQEDDMTFGILSPRISMPISVQRWMPKITSCPFMFAPAACATVSLRANRFPASSVGQLSGRRLDDWFQYHHRRIPGTGIKFYGGEGQSFLDEVAEAAGKIPSHSGSNC